jgi:menaquinone-dependent protoporphyrinogen IX oxidase
MEKIQRILVVYYSRSGFTQAIARQLARSCRADLEAIVDDSGRSRVVGYARSAVEAALHLAPEIAPSRHRPSDYDLVVIGTPIWFWNIASPVRAYIKRHRSAFRRVAFFCTMGGSGDAKVLRDLKYLCGRPAVATFSVSDAEISGRKHRQRLSEFSAALTASPSLLRGYQRRRIAALSKPMTGR